MGGGGVGQERQTMFLALSQKHICKPHLCKVYVYRKTDFDILRADHDKKYSIQCMKHWQTLKRLPYSSVKKSTVMGAHVKSTDNYVAQILAPFILYRMQAIYQSINRLRDRRMFQLC